MGEEWNSFGVVGGADALLLFSKQGMYPEHRWGG